MYYVITTNTRSQMMIKKVKIHLSRTEIMVVYLKVITRVCERVDLIKTGPVIKKKSRIKTPGVGKTNFKGATLIQHFRFLWSVQIN